MSDGTSDEERYRRTLQRIAEAVGCSVDDLVRPGGLGDESARTVELLRLWQKVGLPQTQRAVIEHLKRVAGEA